jgi:hypothetical protein
MERSIEACAKEHRGMKNAMCYRSWNIECTKWGTSCDESMILKRNMMKCGPIAVRRKSKRRIRRLSLGKGTISLNNV